MIKNLFFIAAMTVLMACGGNQQAKQTGDDAAKECSGSCSAEAVCIGKAIANPADFENKETVFSAKIAQCEESGNYYATAGENNESIEIIPGEGVALSDALDKMVTIKGKVVDGKIEVSAINAGCCSGKTEGEGCCKDKEAQASGTESGCCGEKAQEANVSDAKGGCCGNKAQAAS